MDNKEVLKNKAGVRTIGEAIDEVMNVLSCSNGMISEQTFSRVHLGRERKLILSSSIGM